MTLARRIYVCLSGVPRKRNNSLKYGSRQSYLNRQSFLVVMLQLRSLITCANFWFSLSGWPLKDLHLSCLDTLENILICLQEWFDDVIYKVTHQGWLKTTGDGTLRVVASTYVTCDHP